MDDTALIREVESTIVDSHHRSFMLFRLPDETAIIRLLKVAGDLHRDLQNDPRQSINDFPRNRFHLNRLFLGLCHALRWVASDCPAGSHDPNCNWRDQDEMGLQCLKWSTEYASLVRDYMSWGHGLTNASIDTDRKRVC